jgi:hypothetical protein
MLFDHAEHVEVLHFLADVLELSGMYQVAQHSDQSGPDQHGQDADGGEEVEVSLVSHFVLDWKDH